MPYEVVEQPSAPHVELRCDDCGGDNIERQFWCVWNVEDQRWVIDTPDDAEEDYCADCGERVQTTEQNI